MCTSSYRAWPRVLPARQLVQMVVTGVTGTTGAGGVDLIL